MTRNIVVKTTGKSIGSNLNDDDKVKVYTEMLNKLRDELRTTIPELDPNQQELFRKTCLNVIFARTSRDAADKSCNDVPNDDKQRKEDANKAVEEAQKTLDTAIDINVDAAKPILNTLDLGIVHLPNLMKCFILIDGTPERLGTFANRGPEQAALVDNLLNDSDLSRQVLLACGAKGGEYGKAMTIYHDIQKKSSDLHGNDALQRLALGTALEHATPMAEFDTPTIFVNPVERYLHYEQAYLTGELDPTFSDRTVWEYRMITNCDAPNEQLGWCRSMLRNYRPDEMLTNDYIWRYCRIVRTEVGYRRPEWTSTPRTYQQIVSGGGQCGPRAWFGRFACKSFGIPTWGARQPGHAMVHHWTPTGWVGILGADWKYSTWEGRCGPDFLLETQARVNEDDYFNKVRKLEFIGKILGEKALDGNSGLADPNSLWLSLALMAKKMLATTKKPVVPSKPTIGVKNLIDACQTRREAYNKIMIHGDGTIIIPAECCSKPKKSTNNIIFMKSFLGGMQVNCREGDAFEYTLSDIPSAGTYQVTLRICTVHLKQQPLLLTVNNNADDGVCLANIVVPYTVGEWQYTDQVEVDLAQGDNTLCFQRETPNFGLTIKDITLTPKK
jgi:hypothetical protein